MSNIYIIILIIIIAIRPLIKIEKEEFVDRDLRYKLEPLMCYGFYFRIWVPFIGDIRLCIPGLYIPGGGRKGEGASGRDCDGSDVCE